LIKFIYIDKKTIENDIKQEVYHIITEMISDIEFQSQEKYTEEQEKIKK
jgi:hypothetical protein